MASINIHARLRKCVRKHTDVGWIRELQGFPQVEGGCATPEPELHRNPGSRLNINSVLNGYISNAGNKLYTYTRMWGREEGGGGGEGRCVGRSLLGFT